MLPDTLTFFIFLDCDTLIDTVYKFIMYKNVQKIYHSKNTFLHSVCAVAALTSQLF